MNHIAITATLDPDTRLSHDYNGAVDEVHVNLNTPTSGIGLWTGDEELLERLAAEATSALNTLREERARIAGAA